MILASFAMLTAWSPIDVVVERDHLVRERSVAVQERGHGAAEGLANELSLGEERGLERGELLLERDPHG